MFFPKCPSCGNSLPISAFLIKPKEKRFKIENTLDAPKLRCDKCMAAIRTNPKFYYLVSAVWVVAGIILLVGAWIRVIKFTAFIIIMIVLAGIISMLLSWHFLEVTDQEKKNK